MICTQHIDDIICSGISVIPRLGTWRTSGVPQGTVLGPALFLCYINSMPEGISSSIRLFADDTVIDRQINSAADHTILQQDLHKLARWEAEYSMEFHPEKCNVLRVTRSRSPSMFNYTLHGTNLKSTESTKCLGVTLTKDLTWGKHIDIIRAKANQQLAFVRRNIRTRSSSTKEKLFNTLVRPHLECCDCLGPAHLQAETLARDGTTKSCEMGNQQTS